MAFLENMNFTILRTDILSSRTKTESFAYQKARQSPYDFIWPLGTPIGCKEVL